MGMDVALPVPSECPGVKVSREIRGARMLRPGCPQPGYLQYSHPRPLSSEAVVHFVHLGSFHSSEGSFLCLEILTLLVWGCTI